MSWRDVFRSSETYAAILAVVGSILIQAGVVDTEHWQQVTGLVLYIVLRVTGKVAKAKISE